MGRKLDLSGLTDNEAEHVLQVVQRDMRLRKKEEQRLSELKQELDEEGSRCLLLSRRSCFNQRCCIRCCSPFTFLLNPKRQCHDCHYNVCKACRVYNKRDKAWLCSACQKSRLLKTQSLEWFYTNVKTRFKRFGSAKVLKTLYRKHLSEHSALSELTESSIYEDSICNEGSFCGSDSTFYRQTQEHSIAETITVALRVAEEAIDEAISKAEFDSASQEKQNEAHYLREHRGELIEELSKSIVQKIISRRKTLTEMRAEYDQDWPLEHNPDLHHHHHHHQSDCEQASSSLKHQPDLWRSHSAFSLSDIDPSGLIQDSSQALKDGGGSATSTWNSVERLDNTGVYGCVSSVLKSPDGNWIALQSAQLARPSLLTRRKSLVFSALERESEVVSAYEGMDSDNETKSEHSARVRTPSPLAGSRDDLFSDPEGNWKPNNPLLARFKRKVPTDKGRSSSSCRTSILDVNFNVEGAKEEEERKGAAKPDMGKVRRSRKKRRSKKESSSSVLDYREKDNHSQHSSDAATASTLTSGATTPELLHLESDATGHEANQVEEELTLKLQQRAGRVTESSTGGGGGGDVEVRDVDKDGEEEEKRQGSKDRGEDDERPWRMETDLDEGRTEEDEVDEEMKYRLYRLIAQSRLTYLSTDDDLDKDGQSEGEWEGAKEEDMEEEKTDGLASKLCQLEKEVRANQFSSTEDELDRAGRGEEGEGAIDENLWKLQAEKDVQAVPLRDLASLISASQFSSTEDELDKVGENEVEEEMNEEGIERAGAVVKNWNRRESFGGGGEGREEGKIRGGEESQDTATDSDEEDAEFDRIISSMLTMTLEDMQMEAIKDDAAENRSISREPDEVETDEDVKIEGEGGFKDIVKPQSTNASEETGSAKEFQSRGDNVTPESAVRERPGENVGQQIGVDIYRRKESRDATGTNENERQEKDRNAQEKTHLEIKETLEAKQTYRRLEMHDDEQEDRKVANELKVMDTLGAAAEGDCERKETKDENADDMEQSTSSLREGSLSPEEIQNGRDMELYKTIQFISTLLEQRYSAVSLRSITTEVLMVLNATEELLLLQGVEAGDGPRLSNTSLPPDTDPKKLDQQFSRLEENVYVAAGEVYSLEAELGDLEECARGISSATPDTELSFLEEQVASAAAKVQQSELQICDISARIAALKSAGLNVDTQQSRFTKTKTVPIMPVVESSRQQRRRLPAPPVKEDKEET
ncbi:hypothetical protein VZT92_003845 [Zoarces viviparus]|uniref:RabBD domain-containing protein n=1 Tax=Zoarces viviparus TaxID=48416 RepID=A0AAW1FWI7_ZOAVI